MMVREYARRARSCAVLLGWFLWYFAFAVRWKVKHRDQPSIRAERNSPR